MQGGQKPAACLITILNKPVEDIWIADLRADFPEIDYDQEIKLFNDHWCVRTPPKSVKLAVRKWFIKAREIAADKHPNSNGIDKYHNQKYANMVATGLDTVTVPAPPAYLATISTEVAAAAALTWDKVKGRLHQVVNESNYNCYVDSTKGLGTNGQRFAIQAPTQFGADYLARNMLGVLERELAEVIGETVKLDIVAAAREEVPA